MSKRAAFRDLLTAMRSAELAEYGAVIPGEFVRGILGITLPESASKAVFDGLALLELAAIDYVREHLLNEGKYIAGTKTGYRILLPSENKGQVEIYVGSADKKLARALKLSRNTPRTDTDAHPDQTAVRILMKRESVKRMGCEATP